MTPENDPVLTILLAIIIIIFAVVFLVGITVKLKEFLQALNYINIEIGRTTGESRRYWKREKRRLWLSLLPFYRR